MPVWTAEHERFLIDHYAALGPAEVARQLDRTYQTVRARALKLGVVEADGLSHANGNRGIDDPVEVARMIGVVRAASLKRKADGPATLKGTGSGVEV